MLLKTGKDLIDKFLGVSPNVLNRSSLINSYQLNYLPSIYYYKITNRLIIINVYNKYLLHKYNNQYMITRAYNKRFLVRATNLPEYKYEDVIDNDYL